jgi:hypothetical protein
MNDMDTFRFRARYAWAKWVGLAKRIEADPILLAFVTIVTVLAVAYVLM